MLDFKHYDSAFARRYDTLDRTLVPILAWNFHREYLDEVKNIYVDCIKLNLIASNSKWGVDDWDFKNKLKEEVIIVTDAKLEIVFASHNLTKMNGYREEEVMGRTPKMFHGSATNSLTSNEIRKAIQLQEPFEKTVLNYKKNGDTYLCLIKGFPVFNRKGELSHFIAFEKAA
ncbi:PAS domain-containing protein [Flavobacterium frigoris]|uniref:PAS domain S-box-containing protein n=1 Tax=Flavobacterium frigoris TaxID=229204 RepID=A0A1H9D6J0_FLAFI|nr:PAS domain-containing protein [Flavobacterium frigoris]SEQ09096.1 PAS domain S-box-containing protein [Flavobacterium frigoris]